MKQNGIHPNRCRLLGQTDVDMSQTVRFNNGLPGIPPTEGERFSEYLLLPDPSVRPVRWLVGLGPNGPEIPVVEPARFAYGYTLDTLGVSLAILEELGAASIAELDLYAVLSLSEDLDGVAVNLRSPILVNPRARRGIQLAAPELRHWPVRHRLSWDLLVGAAAPEERMERRVVEVATEEAVDIGWACVLQAIPAADGSVRMLVAGPGTETVRRGAHAAVTAVQNQLAVWRSRDCGEEIPTCLPQPAVRTERGAAWPA